MHEYCVGQIIISQEHIQPNEVPSLEITCSLPTSDRRALVVSTVQKKINISNEAALAALREQFDIHLKSIQTKRAKIFINKELARKALEAHDTQAKQTIEAAILSSLNILGISLDKINEMCPLQDFLPSLVEKVLSNFHEKSMNSEIVEKKIVALNIILNYAQTHLVPIGEYRTLKIRSENACQKLEEELADVTVTLKLLWQSYVQLMRMP